MTVNTININDGPYAGNGIVDTFSYTFKIEINTQLVITETNDLGVETVLTLTDDYTVTGVGNDAGGTVVRVAGPLPTGYEWFIRSNYQPTQLTSFESQGSFLPKTHEDAFDKLTFLIQQMLDSITRSPSVPEDYTGTLPLTMDSPLAGFALRWNGAETGLENYNPSTVTSEEIAADKPVINYSSLSAAVADTSITLNQACNLKERNVGGGGGALWDVVTAVSVTPNTYDIVQCTGVPTLALVLRRSSRVQAITFGLLTDGTGTATNNAVMQRLVDYCTSFAVGQRPIIIWPAGNIAYTTSPNWGHSNLRSMGAGSGNTRFTYSGTGVAWNIDPSDFDVAFRYGIHHSGFTIDCGASATSGVYEENIAHSTYRDVILINGTAAVCVHWYQALTVLNTYTDCGSPLDRFTVTTAPLECLRLAASPSKLQACTANNYNNWIAEGSSTVGIRLINADVNIFTGGTAESNVGRGVLIGAACRSNSFNNLDMEANTGEDFNDAGLSTNWNNCLATSTSGATLSGSAILGKIRGGYYNTIAVESGARGCVVEDVSYNSSGSGTFTDSGTDTVKRNIYNFTTTTFLVSNIKGSRFSITVGASPFIYTNGTRQLQQVLVRGGTITQVLWQRDGDVAIVGGAGEGANVNDQFLLAPGDQLNVSYSVAPAMNGIPMGVAYL